MSHIYKVTKDIESESRANNFMGPSIHENVELKHSEEGKYPIVYGESSKGNKFAAFHFVNDKGEVLVHTEYQPSADTSKPDHEEKLANKTLNQIKRFKHIITKFIPEDEFVLEADGFESFVKQCIQKLGNKYVGKKVRVKVTLNNNDYTSLPNYVPFIESMAVTTEKSKLSINTAMDKMVKSQPDVESTKSTNPFAETNGIQTTQDSDINIDAREDLPF
jgi:hypothetical protein